MFNLLNSEIFRMVKRRQSWLLFIIATVLSALIYFGFVIAARMNKNVEGAAEMRKSASFSGFDDFGISLSVGFFSGIMLIIVASNMMGNEFSWNTLRPLVARARSRVSLLTAKYTALVIYALVFVIALTLVVAGYFFIGALILGQDSGFTIDRFNDGAIMAGKLLYTNIPYMALAFALATVFRSNAAGIAGALGLSFIEQPVWLLLGLASKSFKELAKFGISHNAQAVAAPGEANAAGVQEWAILAGYSVLFIIISYVVFLRRDVTSG